MQHKNTTILFTEVDTQGRYGVVKNKDIYKTDKSEQNIIESEKEGGKQLIETRANKIKIVQGPSVVNANCLSK